MTTGKLLKSYRMRGGLNQKELAEKMSLSNNFICMVEGDKRKASLQHIAEFSQFFNLSNDEKAALVDSAKKTQ